MRVFLWAIGHKTPIEYEGGEIADRCQNGTGLARYSGSVPSGAAFDSINLPLVRCSDHKKSPDVAQGFHAPGNRLR